MIGCKEFGIICTDAWKLRNVIAGVQDLLQDSSKASVPAVLQKIGTGGHRGNKSKHPGFVGEV